MIANELKFIETRDYRIRVYQLYRIECSFDYNSLLVKNKTNDGDQPTRGCLDDDPFLS